MCLLTICKRLLTGHADLSLLTFNSRHRSSRTSRTTSINSNCASQGRKETHSQDFQEPRGHRMAFKATLVCLTVLLTLDGILLPDKASHTRLDHLLLHPSSYPSLLQVHKAFPICYSKGPPKSQVRRVPHPTSCENQRLSSRGPQWLNSLRPDHEEIRPKAN